MNRVSQTLAGMTVACLAACGGDGGGPSEPSGPSLATIEVSPTTASIFNTAPGNTAAISVVAKNQAGGTFLNATKAFSSDNTAVATVAGDGVVTAVAVGTARITTSVTAGGTTRSAVTTVSVVAPPAAAAVTAPALLFLPGEAHVTAGGTVTWTTEGIPHTVTFSTANAPESVGQLLGASASRTFPNRGSYPYTCQLHLGMTGVVHVH